MIIVTSTDLNPLPVGAAVGRPEQSVGVLLTVKCERPTPRSIGESQLDDRAWSRIGSVPIALITTNDPPGLGQP